MLAISSCEVEALRWDDAWEAGGIGHGDSEAFADDGVEVAERLRVIGWVFRVCFCNLFAKPIVSVMT